MKTFKTILAAVLFLSATNVVFAQENLTATADATAKIIVEVNVNKLQDINFGELILNTTANLNVIGGANANMNGSPQFGKFSVIATEHASIGITWETGDLTHSGGATLAYTPQVAHTTDVAAEDGTEFEEGDFIASEADYFLIGGTLVVPIGSPAGEYEGSFTLTAEIN
jgi:hypothetical protein